MTLATSDILIKTTGLYKKFGIRNITMSDISNELGISKKTLYQYIKDKEALIEMVLSHEFNELKESLNIAIKGSNDPILQFIELKHSLVENLSDQSGVMGYELKKYYPEKYERYFHKYLSLLADAFNQNLSGGIHKGIYREDLDIDHVIKTHLVILLNMMNNDISELKDFLSEKYDVEGLRYHLRAIVNKSQLDKIDKYLETIKPVVS